MRSTRISVIALLSMVMSLGGSAVAQENPGRMELAGGKLRLLAPEDWQRKQPRTSIVEYEFTVPAAQGDTTDGRLTVMSAGGGIDANIDRWYGQFTQPDGGSTRERAKIKKLNVGGEDVHLVDLSGTYKDQAGPLAPATERPKYRMLAAIIPSKGAGTYYLKFYGPERTVTAQEKAFVSMIEGLERK
ncbi:MAG: hypothetical protein WD845_08930 [Pirellulales bacterium]